MPEGWNTERELPMIELSGKTALVIGLGGIGTQIAQRAAAFGMTVVAVDPKDIPIHRDVAYVGKPDETRRPSCPRPTSSSPPCRTRRPRRA